MSFCTVLLFIVALIVLLINIIGYCNIMYRGDRKPLPFIASIPN